MKHIYFTVTNDLTYDQRMLRICTSLSHSGMKVTLVGRKLKSSIPLQERPFLQKRLLCFFTKGPLFYIEYNIRLFFYLFVKKMDCICAIDLDTIIPVFYISWLKGVKRVYDAHELFSEMKEVVSRPRIHKIWKSIERTFVPRFKNGSTVNTYIRDILKKEYQVDYGIIRNIPPLNSEASTEQTENFILYQGAINEGRSFETLIPAFQWIDCPLHLYGGGNFMDQAESLIVKYNLQNKVFLKGSETPEQLKRITVKAILGITIFENKGLSNYYSLANRFFDYMHACIPQLCVNYPAYKEINDEFKVAVLVDDLSSRSLAENINRILKDRRLQEELRSNCFRAREKYNWQNEEKLLFRFYQKVLIE